MSDEGKVKRYDYPSTTYYGDQLIESEFGDWVDYEDYDRLATELREAEEAIRQASSIFCYREEYQEDELPAWNELPAVQRALARNKEGS